MCPYGDHSRIGSALRTTENASFRFGSQVVIGSTKSPVENSQYRTAPTPRPTILARTGYAMPTRKGNSVGGGRSGKWMMFRHTTFGGAATSIVVVTANVGSTRDEIVSTPMIVGARNTHSKRTAVFGRNGCRQIEYPKSAPIAAKAAATGVAIAMQTAPSSASASNAAAVTPTDSSATKTLAANVRRPCKAYAYAAIAP